MVGIIGRLGDWLLSVRKSANDAKELFDDVDVYRCSDVHGAPFYETDFGWGKPRWVMISDMLVQNVFILFNTPDGDGIKAVFEKWLSFDTNPLYALMHESIYCQGAASRWAAHRVRTVHESKFDAIKAAKEGRPVLFTGEMVFPWMFDEIHALRPFKEAAILLAEKKDWPPLYDKKALNKNKVPFAAAIYYEDMFVNFNLAIETAAQIAGIRLWVTNEYMHSGLRDGAGHVLDHLMRLLNGSEQPEREGVL